MNIKKLSAIILSCAVLFSFAACQNDRQENADLHTDITSAEADTAAVAETEVSVPETELTDYSTEVSEESSVTAEETSEDADNPESWSSERIAEVYKAAAAKTHSSVKSQHSIDLKSISVNDGQYEGLFDFITSVMSKLLANNSEDKDGITGGYTDLTADDIRSAKAYKSGKNTVIEMVMKEQVSGARDDALSGSVGHAITAVGDIGNVTKQITDLGIPLEIGDSNAKIYYTDPTVKVVISPDGKILNGTWKYTVEIKLINYRAFGKPVEKTSVIMDNTLTVNGGFSK